VPAPGSLAADIEVDEQRRAVHVPAGVRLDLGGIGKGFAADLVAARLMDDGAAGVVVNLGGDVRVAGDPRMGGGCAHGWGWHIDVTVDGTVLGQLCVASGGAATSSPTARQWTHGGRGVHHLFDPATQAPAIGGARAVTVVAAEAWQAEAVATAACVVPADEAAALLAGTGLSGFVLNPDRGVTPVGDIGRFQHDQGRGWTS
jgi:thiamine biosynthesis lipoprotein